MDECSVPWRRENQESDVDCGSGVSTAFMSQRRLCRVFHKKRSPLLADAACGGRNRFNPLHGPERCTHRSARCGNSTSSSGGVSLASAFVLCRVANTNVRHRKLLSDPGTMSAKVAMSYSQGSSVSLDACASGW